MFQQFVGSASYCRGARIKKGLFVSFPAARALLERPLYTTSSTTLWMVDVVLWKQPSSHLFFVDYHFGYSGQKINQKKSLVWFFSNTLNYLKFIICTSSGLFRSSSHPWPHHLKLCLARESFGLQTE